MSRIVAIQMDPIEHIDIKGDSTFVMGLEAQARGYELLHYHPDDMFYDRGRIKAEVRRWFCAMNMAIIMIWGTPG